MGIDIYFTKVVDKKHNIDDDTLTIGYNESFNKFECFVYDVPTLYVNKEKFEEKYGLSIDDVDLEDGEYYYFYKDDIDVDFVDIFDKEFLKENCKLIVDITEIDVDSHVEKSLTVKEVDYFRKGYGSDSSFDYANIFDELNDFYGRTDFTKEEFSNIVKGYMIDELLPYCDVDFDIVVISY